MLGKLPARRSSISRQIFLGILSKFSKKASVHAEQRIDARTVAAQRVQTFSGTTLYWEQGPATVTFYFDIPLDAERELVPSGPVDLHASPASLPDRVR
jgi:hypothetical protein